MSITNKLSFYKFLYERGFMALGSDISSSNLSLTSTVTYLHMGLLLKKNIEKL